MTVNGSGGTRISAVVFDNAELVRNLLRREEMIRSIGQALIDAAKRFVSHEPLPVAAALSYYALLSMAPLLLIVVGFAGLVFGNDVVERQVLVQLERLVGDEGASVASTVFENASNDADGPSFVLGAALTILGATTVFAYLQMALNRVWDVESAPGNAVLAFLWHRLFSFALIVSIGFLLIVSLVASAVLAGLQELLDAWAGTVLIWRILNQAVSFALAIGLVALILKYLPDARIAWRNVWLGALVTSLLLGAGKWLIGLYIGRAGVGSAFGAAGSVVVFMIWTYYASLLFLFGAEVTRAVTELRHDRAEPAPHAERADDAEPANG